MPVISFEYLPRPYLDKGKLTAIYEPKIIVRLSMNHKMYPYEVSCLLDSGADFNLLPADIAEKLGIKVKKGLVRQHMGIGNVGITAYTHQVKLFLGSHTIATEVDFSYDHKIPLLGRLGLFKFFKTVTFNESQRKVKLLY